MIRELDKHIFEYIWHLYYTNQTDNDLLFKDNVPCDPSVWQFPKHLMEYHELVFESGRKALHGKTVLDIGCGFGWYLSILENMGVSKYIGIDPDVKSIKYAKIMIKNVNLDAEVSLNSVENINCKADTILMLSVNHKLDDQLSVFEKFECQNIILDSWEFQNDFNLDDIVNHFRTLNFQCTQKKLYDHDHDRDRDLIAGHIAGHRHILHFEKNP